MDELRRRYLRQQAELGGEYGEDARAARDGIEAFVGRVQALISTGALDAADGQPPVVTLTDQLRNAQRRSPHVLA